jgi:hypothetical protein
MATNGKDPLLPIAELVADRIGENGYAFVEDDQLDDLVVILHSFLTTAGVPINSHGEADASGDSNAAPAPQPDRLEGRPATMRLNVPGSSASMTTDLCPCGVLHIEEREDNFRSLARATARSRGRFHGTFLAASCSFSGRSPGNRGLGRGLVGVGGAGSCLGSGLEPR